MKVLELTFHTEDDKTAKLSIDQPIYPANTVDVKESMESIIENDVFHTANGSRYVGIKSARFVERTVEDLELD